MKKYRRYLPVIVLLLLAALWLRHIRIETIALQTSIADLRRQLASAPSENRPTEAESAAQQRNNAALLAELMRIEEMTVATQKEIAALELKLPPSLKTEVTESFGSIADMGAELGQYLRTRWMDLNEAEQERERRGITSDELSRSVIQGFVKFEAWAPEIAAMEDTPTEIASLQSIALRETFAFNETQTQQAKAIIEAHFATMKTAGLTFSSHDAPEWQERRNTSLTELLWKLRPLIPTDSKQTPNLPQIVNIGAGMKSDISAYPAGPPVPWLQTTGQ